MRIVFICTGNTCRSPMAAALMRRRMEREGHKGTAESAGLAASGEPASPLAAAVLAEWGLSVADHRSRQATAGLCGQADMVAVMTAAHAQILRTWGVPADKIWILAEGEGGIPDPYGGNLEEYRRTRDALAEAVEKIPLK